MQTVVLKCIGYSFFLIIVRFYPIILLKKQNYSVKIQHIHVYKVTCNQLHLSILNATEVIEVNNFLWIGVTFHKSDVK